MSVDIGLDKGLIDEGVKALTIGDLKGAAHKIHQAYKKLINDDMVKMLENGESKMGATQPAFFMSEGIPIFVSYGEEEEMSEDVDLRIEEFTDTMLKNLTEKGETFCHVDCKGLNLKGTGELFGVLLMTFAVEGKTNRSYTKAERYTIVDEKIRWEIVEDSDDSIEKMRLKGRPK